MPQNETGERYVYTFRGHYFTLMKNLLIFQQENKITEKIEPTTIPIGQYALELDKNESFYLV